MNDQTIQRKLEIKIIGDHRVFWLKPVDSDVAAWVTSAKSASIEAVEAEARLFEHAAKMLSAVRALIHYRDAAGPLGFQLEKADDYINALRTLMQPAEVKQL